jgi:hypothetical protein
MGDQAMDYVTRTHLDAAEVGLQYQILATESKLNVKLHEALMTKDELLAGIERLGKQTEALRLELKTEVQAVRSDLKAEMQAGFFEMNKKFDEMNKRFDALNTVASNGYGVHRKRFEDCEADIKVLNDAVFNRGQ